VGVIYRVTQITHRAITANKRDHVIVTMHASKLKIIQEQNIYVIPCFEIERMKPPYVCPGCFIHTYSNNMINRFHVQNTSTLFITE
jgi:hypothetical protein